MRTAATIKNAVWALIYQLIFCLLSLVSRKVMVITIGAAGVGLNGLFANVLTMLTLAEMGVGSAIVYHLYKPIAEDDRDKICQLMNFYKTAYRAIALLIAAIGVALIPLLPKIVKNVDYQNSYITMIYLLFLVQTVSSYFFAYKRSLLEANQKQYLITIIDLIFRFITVAAGIVILLATKSFACYLISLIVLGIINNIFVARKVDALYPYVNKKSSLPKQEVRGIFKNVKDIFIGRLSGKVTNSTDNILISALVGTVQVGLYSNYTIIINVLTNVMEQLTSAAGGSVGNLLITEQGDYIDIVLKRLTFFMFFIGAFCPVSLFCVLNPFVSLFFGDQYQLGIDIVAVAAGNFFLCTMRAPLWKMLNVSGLFQKDKYISLAGTAANLIVSVILGLKIGTLGILIGTTCTIVIQYVLKIALFYREFLKLHCLRYYCFTLFYCLVLALETAATYFLCVLVPASNPLTAFFIKVLICAAVPNLLNLLLFYKTSEFHYFKDLLKKTIKRFA